MKIIKYLVLFLFVLLPEIVSAKKIIVGQAETIKTIKQAILIAQDGDSIIVRKGVYKEGNIIIEKSIVVIGEDYPVLDGENKYEILTIHADNVQINGFFLKDTGTASIEDLAAIKVLDSRGVKILNNKLRNTFFGIYFANSTNSWVEHNDLESKAVAEHQIGNGLHMWKCEHITINGNKIKGHRDGIYFEFVTNSLIINNFSQANIRYGLHFMFSHFNEYRENTFKENGAGVSVMYTKGIKMINNTFEHNWGSASYGLLLKDIRDSFVTGNRFIENSVGIHMEGSSRIEFKKNIFESNGYGIRLQASCDDNVITENNFFKNTFDMATNGSLVLNKVYSNYWDRYEGYDLNKDKVGDIPYRPVSMYAMVVERMPTAVLLWRSFLVFLLDRAEKAIPAITPENMKDDTPKMRPYDFS